MELSIGLCLYALIMCACVAGFTAGIASIIAKEFQK